MSEPALDLTLSIQSWEILGVMSVKEDTVGLKA